MNISLNWLQDYINIPKSITPEKLGDLLTLHTVEVESVKKLGDNLDKIIVGKIEELKKHSNADKLKLAIVSDGNKKFQVVCGGSNLAEGMLVAFARVGAKVKWHGEGDLVELKPVKIRGEKSEGMICAASEIGLENLFPTDDDYEIVDLQGDFKLGENLAKALKLDDIVYDIDNKSMTHRPDLWSHYGLACELATLMTTNLKPIATNKINFGNQAKIDVKVEDSKLCPRYMAIAVEGIKIKPSSELIQKRLIACGMRPINNIVDISNYVMLELGQPTHAFDAGKLGNKIVIKKAKANEKMTTLDGEERKLDNEMLLITDGKNPIAIAGVMGGGNSEIDKQTTSIILESANFDAVAIRKTSQKLSLRTESSQRYEKSLDPNLCELAVNRILTLIKESCPNAKVSSKLVDEKNFKLNDKLIKLDLDWLNQKIGTEIKKPEVIKILKNLGFEVSGDKVLNIKIPTWRATKDISIPEDLVEEVARIYGYNNIKPVMPLVDMQVPEMNLEREFINKIKDILVQAGVSEAYNYSFVNEAQLQKLDINSQNHIKLANPLNSEHTLLRQSLIPNLLNNVVTNQRNVDQIKIFEIGNIFLSAKDQRMKLGLICASNKDNFYQLKGIIEFLVNKLNLKFEFNELDIVKSGIAEGKVGKRITSTIIIDNKEIGFLNTLEKKWKNNTGIKVDVAICELDITELLETYQAVNSVKYQPKNKFPGLERDMAFVVDEKILYNDIRNEILAVNKLIKEVEVFDVYQEEKIGTGKKSIAFHIIFEDESKTLTGEEADKIQNNIINTLNKRFKAQLRDF